jgi:prevent-host-death family protein
MNVKLNEKTMAAGEFKAKCLAVMDEVQAKRTTVIITKNGKPVAQMVPIIDKTEPDPIFGFMRGKVKIVGDITKPIYTDEEYEAFYKRKDEMYGRAGKSAGR